jgi:hypothetical protein
MGAAASAGPARLPWLLVPLVAALHLAGITWWPADRFGLGEGDAAPPRMVVSFVRELLPAAPPVVPPPVSTRVLKAAAPRAAASAVPIAPIPPSDESLRAAVPPAVPPAAALPEIAAALGPVAADALAPAAAGAPSLGFEWPPSTRLTYLLTGNYRGPVEGQARVEWRLSGERYQVELELEVGPPFAPLVTRQIMSDGLVTAEGLAPRRYDEETRIALRPARRLSIALDADRVVLPSGREVPRPAGVQDSASQFVQMTWLFTTQPQLLRPGFTLDLPLALPRLVETWTYEVVGVERLETLAGEIEAVHVRPRRPPRPPGAPALELAAEFWVAPTLQNLPVRIVIRQDDETYVDLRLHRLPQQAERR